ncbi:MAG: ethanolamine utilization microcompartment protein EutL [Archangiaceae bacterium]|nr:ethanolamine utilization microcompartment protein EutL [Archangiaceae bacterium]
MKRVDLWPQLLACRQIDQVERQLAVALGLDPERETSAGLVTCDQDDSLYVALDHATKFANVEVKFAQSFYAGSKHASGPYSGEILGILAGADPDEVAEGVLALRDALKQVRFQTFEGPPDAHPAFLAHVISETGRYLAPQAGIAPGQPMAYLIAPPLEAHVAVDLALKAAPVKLAKWIPPPSETNFAGAFLTGELHHLEAARDAFAAGVEDVAARPLAAARRPDRERR